LLCLALEYFMFLFFFHVSNVLSKH
jgi:hypothetical protein